MGIRLAGLNKKKLSSDKPEPVQEKCSCSKEPCPRGGDCKAQDVIYGATVKQFQTDKTETYTGMCAKPWPWIS